MKIVERGDPGRRPENAMYRLRCTCGTVAEFSAREFESDRDGVYVKCPVCRAFVSERSRYVTKVRAKP